MEPEETANDHTHLMKAYLRLATESQKIAESPGVVAIRGEPPKPVRKQRKPKEQPPEQLRLF